jgi:hypothetical protein
MIIWQTQDILSTSNPENETYSERQEVELQKLHEHKHAFCTHIVKWHDLEAEVKNDNRSQK